MNEHFEDMKNHYLEETKKKYIELYKDSPDFNLEEFDKELIDKEIKRFLSRKFPQNPAKAKSNEEGNADKNKIYLVLPYFNNKMDDFSKRLTDLIAKYYPNLDFRLEKRPDALYDVYS